jgi:hypothetical protein
MLEMKDAQERKETIQKIIHGVRLLEASSDIFTVIADSKVEDGAAKEVMIKTIDSMMKMIHLQRDLLLGLVVRMNQLEDSIDKEL